MDEKTNNKIGRIFWAAFGIFTLVGAVIIAGAYWHLFTVGCCALMFLAHCGDDQYEDSKKA